MTIYYDHGPPCLCERSVTGTPTTRRIELLLHPECAWHGVAADPESWPQWQAELLPQETT